MERSEVAGLSAPRASGETPESFYGMVGRSPAMRAVFERIERFARSSIPVLILGETGTGKELAARAIRSLSCPDGQFVPLNCGAIPKGLLESELFGHEKGAFTGAGQRHTGLLGQADGGILFLDEVAELDRQAQVELLRAIETGEYRPVGAERLERSEFRVLAATNRDLDTLAAEGEFRADLFYRIAAARMTLPPLRKRLEDIPLLAEHFLLSIRRDSGITRSLRLADGALSLLQQEEWPGNVRQLRNVIESAAAVAAGAIVDASQIAELLGNLAGGSENGRPVPTLAMARSRMERQLIGRTLVLAGGNKTLAARWLDIGRGTLHRKISQLKIEP